MLSECPVLANQSYDAFLEGLAIGDRIVSMTTLAGELTRWILKSCGGCCSLDNGLHLILQDLQELLLVCVTCILAEALTGEISIAELKCLSQCINLID